MSNLAQVWPAGQEKALGGQNLGLPEKPGAEKASVRPHGKELALGNQDLAK
jgi:hypothetical protein